MVVVLVVATGREEGERGKREEKEIGKNETREKMLRLAAR